MVYELCTCLKWLKDGKWPQSHIQTIVRFTFTCSRWSPLSPAPNPSFIIYGTVKNLYLPILSARLHRLAQRRCTHLLYGDLFKDSWLSSHSGGKN